MNKTLKVLSLFLAFVMCISSLPVTVFGADYVKGANSASSSYKSGMYYQHLTSVPLTGDGRTDVVAVALSQLGYQEGNSDGQFSGTESGSSNFTEFNYNMGNYGQGYGGVYQWCASFVAFCLLQSGCTDQNSISDWCRSHMGDKKYIWREVSCIYWAAQLRNFGYFKNSASNGGSYTPVAGDLVFFSNDGKDGQESHIGIVLYTDGSKVYTIEGNTSSASGLETNGGGVYTKSYDLSSTYLHGYGVLPYETVSGIQKIDYSGNHSKASPGLYIASTGKYVYDTLSAANSGTNYTWFLPKYSMFTVTEVLSNNLVKAECVINGQAVTGYISNNSTDRIYQLSAKANEGKSLSSIAVTTKPSKLTYYEGQSFDKTGMIVTATYSDGSTEALSDYAVNGFDSTPGTKTITVSYGGKTAASFTVTVIKKEIVSISVTKKPDKLIYLEGENFEKGSMTVSANYNDGSSVTVSNYTLSGYDSSAGTKTITVTYNTFTTSFDVTVKENTLTNLLVTSLPSKLTYVEGQDFSPIGMVVTAFYSNATSETVTDYTVSGYTSTPGTKTITVSHKDKTATFEITVLPRVMTEIEITSTPTKLSYIEGEALDLSGLTLKGYFNDESSEDISDYTVSGFDSSSVGTKTITVSYGDFSDTFTVIIRKKILSKITVTAKPDKLTYVEGESFDSKGLIVTAYYSNAKEENITDYTLSGYSSTVGTKTITVSYGGKTAYFTASVVAKAINGIKISALPTKLSYLEGDTLDTTGLVVTATYNNGTEITVNDYTVSGYTSDPGEKTITVFYGDFTDSFMVTVNKKSLARIAVKAKPSKLTYKEGESFSKTGMVIVAVYDNGQQEKITTYKVSGYSKTPGTKTIKISYEGKTTSFKVTVKENHKLKTVNYKAATCTAYGYSGDKVCTICNKTVKKGIQVNKKAHTTVTKTTKATLTKNGKVVKTCSVCKKTLSTSVVYYPKTFKLSASSYVYDGKAKTPSVTVKDAKGKTLKSGTDYTLKYSASRKAVGTYKVTITFKGKYTGTKTLTFKILPKTTSLSKLTGTAKGFKAVWKKQTTQTTGYQIEYSTSKSFTAKTTKKLTVKNSKTVSASIGKLSSKKTYYVRIRAYKTVSGSNYYSSWSKVMSVKTK